LKIISYICIKLIFIKVKLNKKIMKNLLSVLAIAFSLAVVSCGTKTAETEVEVVEVETEVVVDEVVETEVEATEETPVVE
jgi:hypothetical protein